MLSIGIDVSKGKSTVCGMKPGGEIVYAPFEVQHTREGMLELVSLLRSSGEEVRAVLESTGSYHCPVVSALLENGIFVSVINSLRMKRFCSQSIRKVKTDRIDASPTSAYLGDTDKVLQMAKADFDKGEYQWVAEVTNTIVFADPTNTDARLLCADALEQLGYQAESGPWRNEYLTAAQELRYGNANFTESAKSTGEMVKALSAPMLFDYMAIMMDKQSLADYDFIMNVTLPDVGEQHMLRVKNGVLLVYANSLSDEADVSITCP